MKKTLDKTLAQSLLNGFTRSTGTGIYFLFRDGTCCYVGFSPKQGAEIRKNQHPEFEWHFSAYMNVEPYFARKLEGCFISWLAPSENHKQKRQYTYNEATELLTNYFGLPILSVLDRMKEPFYSTGHVPIHDDGTYIKYEDTDNFFYRNNNSISISSREITPNTKMVVVHIRHIGVSVMAPIELIKASPCYPHPKAKHGNEEKYRVQADQWTVLKGNPHWFEPYWAS